MICERCNTENLEGSQYCDECGGPLQRAARADSSGAFEASRAPDTAHAAAPATRPSDNAFSISDALSAAPGAETRYGGLMDASKEAEGNHSRKSSFVSSEEKYSSGEEKDATGAANEILSDERLSKASSASAVSSSSEAAAHAKLVIHRGRSVGKEFPMCEDETHIGRWDADGGIFPDVDLDADDPEAKVSRRHARITRRGEQYFIEDLGSTNGTFVNRGRRLLPGDRHQLNDGDEVIVGKTFLRFHVIN